MAKIDSESFNILNSLIDKGFTIHIQKQKTNNYEITVFFSEKPLDHKHFRGKTLTEAISKIRH